MEHYAFVQVWGFEPVEKTDEGYYRYRMRK